MLHFLPKDFPESAEVVTRCLSDFDQTAMSFFAAFPAGSIVIWAALNISFLERYPSFSDGKGPFQPLFWGKFCPDRVRWRTFPTIFGLALDPISPTSRPLWNDMSQWQSGIWKMGTTDFDTRFFKDASRSKQHAVSDHRINEVAVQCLSFLTNRIFPLYSPCFCRISKLRTHPWFTRRRKRILGRGIPRMNAKLPTEFRLEEIPTQSVQLLLSLGFALNYLPALLHSASYSSELVELAKCWWSRKYLHLIFPDETVRAEKAIKEYLLRVSGKNGYILFLDFIFRSQR